MIPTADPDVFIEAQAPGYVRYRRKGDGRRWEVRGTCDRRGDCLVGSVVQAPDGPVVVRDHTHIDDLKRLLGKERIDSELDVPVTPEFRGCCPFTYRELSRGD